jgi:hypothetical protein
MIQISSATVYYQDGTEIAGDKLIETVSNSSNISSTPFPVQFFYNTHCGSCQEAIRYLDEFRIKHPDIEIQYHDLVNSTTNTTLFTTYKEQFNTTGIHYPTVFIGNVAMVGSYDIVSYTEPLSLWYQKNAKVDPITGLITWITSRTA